MASYPYFPFYPADWLASLRNNCLTLEQQGGFLRLLCLCWESGVCGLPDDHPQLVKLSGLNEHSFQNVYEMFIKHPSHPHIITNKRLMIEWDKVVRISELRSQAGRKSGKIRRSKARNKTRTKREQNVNKKGTYVLKSELELESELELKSEPELKSKRKEKEVKSSRVPSATSATWEAYQRAFQHRYGIRPDRNAQVNANLCSFVSRVGQQRAPEIAAFYVQHNNAFYLQHSHSVAMLVKDWHTLKTQWETGRTITQTQARKIDETAGRVNVFQNLIEKRKKRKGVVINVEPTPTPSDHSGNDRDHVE